MLVTGALNFLAQFLCKNFDFSERCSRDLDSGSLEVIARLT